MKLSPGDLIDQKYRIVRLLGTGGMGSVYEAENTRVARRVAIKVMHKVRDRQDVARFEREARAAQIGSPHIVQVFDLGYLADGAPYMVMEYLAGETLGQRVQRLRCLQPHELLPIARQILDGLGAAHRAGIIHRDLKPDNVFLSRFEGSDQEVVKLLDFGISKFTDAARKAADVSLTKSGVAVGTPHYMSPEQVQGSKELDTRTDLYSLGVILYRCLSGQLPFQSEDVAPLLFQILLEAPKPLHEVRPDLDPALEALIARSMARRAEDRFQTATEFLAAISAWEITPGGATVASHAPGQTAVAERAHSGHYGTNPPWSSTASPVQGPRRTVRNFALAAVFSIAGVFGLLVAYQLWTSGKAQVKDANASDAVPTPEVSAVVGPSRVVVADAPPARAPDVAPEVSIPRDVTSRSSSASAALAAERSSSARERSRIPRTASSAVTPTPVDNAAQTPAKSSANAEEDPDNRHMSRGFR